MRLLLAGLDSTRRFLKKSKNHPHKWSKSVAI